MQQDTVLQHSRMYGYRSKEDLAVTRFYTTKDLYNRMSKINDFEHTAVIEFVFSSVVNVTSQFVSGTMWHLMD